MIKALEIIDFKKIFDTENSEDYLNRIENIPQSLLLDATSYLTSFHSGSDLVENHSSLLSKWFGKENFEFANEINEKIIFYNKSKSTKTGILNPRTSLKLFESVLSSNRNVDKISNEDFEKLLFKIYLALNEKLNKNDDLIIESVKNFQNYPQFISLAIATSLPTSDISNYNLKSVFIGQVIKAVFLFEFLVKQASAELLLKCFFERFNVIDFKGFLQKLLPFAFLVMSPKKEGSITINVLKDESYQSNIDFLDKLVVNDIDYKKSENDYLTLRANPLFKIEESSYRVISPLFAIEKIFNGLYFILKEINDSIDEQLQINLRQLITYEFSEKYLLYKIIERTYPKKYFKLSGDQMNTPGVPDYYIRNGNKVFLFESKDVFIRSDVKESYDFKQYEKALKSKLYFEAKGKKESPKAVRQLANFAKTLLKNEFKLDSSYKPKSLKIYPIILLHNRQLDIMGLNNLINIWFDLEKDKIEKSGLSTKKLRYPTIIHIDTLFVMHEQLKSGKYKLDTLLDDYQNLINGKTLKKKKFQNEHQQKQFIQNRLASFNMYFDIRYSWKVPSIFKEKGIDISKNPDPNNMYI
ncbi:hypothetical protein [Pararhodonellum marinum]|uniref:hypothetical protein n=1 Tax=Pararhodonellum marinum TaxID=2755358 RepID=UPI00188FA2E0|nr:hypothetical protein [Pararhodonellum marinum]